MLGKRSSTESDAESHNGFGPFSYNKEEDLFQDILPNKAGRLSSGGSDQSKADVNDSKGGLVAELQQSNEGVSQHSQNGLFSATFSQFRDYAYQQHPIESYTPAYNTVSHSSNHAWYSTVSSTARPLYPYGQVVRDDYLANDPTVMDIAASVSVELRVPVAIPTPISIPAAVPVSVPVPYSVVKVPVPPAALLAPPPAGPTRATSAPAPTPKAIMYFDGGALGNPGVGGAGYLVYPDSAQPPHVQSTVPFAQAAVRMHGNKCTNNQAEYTGLIHGLQTALAHGVRTLVVYGDSELVIKQMKGEYKVKNPVLQGMNQRAQQLARNFSHISYNWIERSKNKPADALSRRAMNQASSAEECAEECAELIA